MEMKKLILSVLLAAAFAPTVSMAEQGDWVVRLRAASVNPNDDSRLGKTVNNLLGAPVMSPGADLVVDNNLIPELDISYYLTKNIALELILATGSKHDVKIKGDSAGVVGNQHLGEVDALPPTLTAQWHFNPDQKFDPYVGVGVNYTVMLDRYLRGESGAINGNKIKIDRDSFGFAVQAGFDVNLDNGWLVNADVKYITLDTDVELRGPVTGGVWRKIDSLDINPWVIGIGIGKKF